MTLDDSPGVEWRRRRDHENALTRDEWLQREAEEGDAAAERHWQGAFEAHTDSQLARTDFDDKPGLDRRLHAIDGERQPLQIPDEWVDL